MDDDKFIFFGRGMNCRNLSSSWRSVISSCVFIAALTFPPVLAFPESNQPKMVNLSVLDGGSTTDVTVGTTLNVLLRVPEGEIYDARCHWSKIVPTDDTMLQEINKEVLLPTGVTAATFKAVQKGTVELKSTRNSCSTDSKIEWHVNIRIS